MRRVLIYPALCLSLALGTACSRDDRDKNAVAGGDDANGEQVEVTGCLTSNTQTNQFVLTANANALTSMTSRAAAGEAETFHYQLVGGSNLQSYVGQQITVKGTVSDDGRDVDMEAKDSTAEPKSRGEEVTPAVESSQEIEMQVKGLTVASVTPTGSPCQIGQP
jgi:hypothetical protein